MPRYEELAYWINQRWKLFKKEPVDDPHMTIPRYCNVHRENDRVTKWIATNWRAPNVHTQHFVPAMVLARLVNWPATLDLLGYPYKWGPEYIAHALSVFRNTEGKRWTSAYTISTCGEPISREEYVLRLVHSVVGQERNLAFENYTLEDAHDALMEIRGLGSFLAAQVIADLKNTHGHPLYTAQDWVTWCAPGPGSLRGLGAVYGRRIKPPEFDPLIKLAWEQTAPFIDEMPLIHMQDFQNCLCEFSKYIRIKEGDGQARNKYTPWGN
jgi:hypothetical protein